MSIAQNQWDDMHNDTKYLVRAIMGMLRESKINPIIEYNGPSETLVIWVHAFRCVKISLKQQKEFPVKSYDSSKQVDSDNFRRRKNLDFYTESVDLQRVVNSAIELVTTETDSTYNVCK